jgi:hypothetical protein
MGPRDQRTKNISGLGAFLSWSFRQSQRAARAELHGAHASFMNQLAQALPVLTLPAPSERSNLQRGCRSNILADWPLQGALQLPRRLPGLQIIFMGDSSFVVHDLAHAITRRQPL